MNLLITGAWGEGSKRIPEIEAMGHNTSFLQFEKEKLPCEYEWVEGIICNGIFLYHNIEKFVNLKYIQLTSAGFDRVPIEYIRSHNIRIHNARGVYSVPMAEFVVWGILDFYKKNKVFIENQNKHIWEKQRNLLELSNKTVCILGCGSVGIECAKRLKAFDTKVLGVDIVNVDVEFFDSFFSFDDIKSAIEISDIVIITLPLTEQTNCLFNDEIFDVMKKNSLLVNISRGGIVDTNSLIKALNNKLSGALIDVFESEPLDNASPLWDLDNIIITPHNSFVGEGNNERLYNVIIKNLKSY